MSSLRGPAAGLVLLGTVACTSVQQVREPAQFIPQAKPAVVVVFYHDNAQVPVADPRISGDTLLGTWAGLGEPVAVPLSEVRRMEAVQRSSSRTTFLIAGLTALTVGGVYAISSMGGSGSVCDAAYAPPTIREGRCVGQM